MTYKSQPITTLEHPVFVSISEYQGKTRLDIRHYYTNNAGELAPTQEGISAVIEDAPAIIQAVLSICEYWTTTHTETSTMPRTGCYMPIKVSADEYRGKVRIDIRHYYIPKGKHRYEATRKGVSIPVSSIPALQAAMIEVREAITPTRRTTPVTVDTSGILAELGYESQAEIESRRQRMQDLAFDRQFAQREQEQEQAAFVSKLEAEERRFAHVEF